MSIKTYPWIIIASIFGGIALGQMFYFLFRSITQFQIIVVGVVGFMIFLIIAMVKDRQNKD
jgi:hypothetical protein